MLLMQIFCFSHVFTVLGYALSCNILNLLIICSYQINTIQYRQATAQLENAKIHLTHPILSKYMLHYIVRNIRKYYENHTLSLKTTKTINKIYGKLLLIFLLLNTPINAYLIMSMFVKEMSTLTKLFVIVAVLYQFTYIIGLHLLAMNYSKEIHRSSKLLLNTNVLLVQNSLDRRNRILISLYIFKIHVKLKYGITYGSICLVTFATFLRVSTTIHTVKRIFHQQNKQQNLIKFSFQFIVFYSKSLIISYKISKSTTNAY